VRPFKSESFCAVVVTALLPAVVFAQAEPAPPTMQHFDESLVDKAVDPCADFYAFACNTWVAQNPIPPDRGAYTRGAHLQQVNQLVLRDVLEAASQADRKRSPAERQIGDAYAACTDEAGIEKRGILSLKPDLDGIARLANKTQIGALLGRLHLEQWNLAPATDAGGGGTLFLFGQAQDFDNAKLVVGQVDQGGLALPERAYYSKTDAQSTKLRDAYRAHIERMFVLLGDKPASAAAEAKAALEIETALAAGAMDIVMRRDPANLNHKLNQAELEKLAPSFDWKGYLKAVGAPALVPHILVATPGYLTALEAQLQGRSIGDWKAYLRWHLVHAAAPLLPRAFVDENFSFFGKEIVGATALPPRWRRCAIQIDADLGEALGAVFAEKTFGAEGRRRMETLVLDLRKALATDIAALDWMSPETKKQAQVKLDGILGKIGYPEKPRDYSSITISRTDALANAFAASRFELARQLAKIGKPIDRTEWGMTAPTVNAYYDPQMNTINFPAGILQPPFFDASMDDAVNYGAIGSVIGHEITHGFDDQGRKYDATGNLRDWWTADDGKKFDARAACVADEYSGFEPLPGLHVNGKLTLGENTADTGGVRIALMALRDRLAAQKKAADDDVDRRFFLAYAQARCSNLSDAYLRTLVSSNPHSPPRYRVNGVLQNLVEFQRAYSCKAGQKMVSPKVCSVW
jgi:putative endopeptidase